MHLSKPSKFSIAEIIAFWVGAVEYKLFVGSMNKQATETEVEEVCQFIN